MTLVFGAKCNLSVIMSVILMWNNYWSVINKHKDMNYYDLHYPVRESESGISFRLKTPGYKKEELKIDVVGDNLIVSGYSPDEKTFEKPFLIADRYDINQSKAVYENGILTITVPKKATTTIAIE